MVDASVLWFLGARRALLCLALALAVIAACSQSVQPDPPTGNKPPVQGILDEGDPEQDSFGVEADPLVDPPAEGTDPPKTPTRRPDIHWVPTPQLAVEKMLELVDLQPGELVYDLGCGDGRIVITAARDFGARGVGIDIDPKRVQESRENVRKNGLEDKVRIEHADIFEYDFSDADVVTLYLLPDLNVKLMPQLRKLRPGTRIVSYQFDMRGARPVQEYVGKFGREYEQTLYKWVVPWVEQPQGQWLRSPDIHFVPTPQEAVDKMLALAALKPGDVLYDLGCGDGRIVVTAARRYGVRAVGIDIDAERVDEAHANVRKNNLEHLVTIVHADIFDYDFSEADVVTLYLLPELNVLLKPQLRKLKPGSRIVSYEFDMRGATPEQVVTDKFGQTYKQTLYKWTVPWEEEEVEDDPEAQLRPPDIHWVPTPQGAVEKMLELAELKPGELLYDLGCGDGRIVVTAAQRYGVRAVGIDIDSRKVVESTQNVRRNEVEHLVRIEHADVFEYDFSDADVVTLYLLPELNVKLMPQLSKLKPGARIVSYEFDMRGAEPARIVTGLFGEKYHQTIYKWVVPWEPEVEKPFIRDPDVVFVPTPQIAVEKMLQMADLKPGEVLYDLGCGDGRIVVTAARRHGVRAVGVDIDPDRVRESLHNVRKNKVEDLVTIVHADIFDYDFSEADVVTLYLLPELNVKLMPKLRNLKPGARIISYEFDMRGARPNQIYSDTFGKGYEQHIYKWVVPWQEDKPAQPATGELRKPDIYFVPTPQGAVDKMLELAQLKPGEVVYDLGCGDGRIVVTAAKRYGVRAVGVDIDRRRVIESQENVRKNGVEDLVTIVHADIFEYDFSEADVVTLYLLPDLNVKLIPQLRNLKPGARIISYEFDMRGAKPARVVTGKFGEAYHQTIYKWVVPWEPENDEPTPKQGNTDEENARRDDE